MADPSMTPNPTAPAPAPAAPAPSTTPANGPEGTPAAPANGGDKKPIDRIEEAQRFIGQQGQQIGELRKANSELTRQVGELVNTLKQQAAANQPRPPDFNDLKQAVIGKLRTGEIGLDEALDKLVTPPAVDAAATTQAVQREVQRIEWLKSHPDFTQLLQSGELDNFAQTHPEELFNDPIDVYRAYKQAAVASEYEQHKAQMPQLVQEAVAKAVQEATAKITALANGAAPAGSVLPAGGTSTAAATTNKPLTQAELREKAYAAFQSTAK